LANVKKIFSSETAWPNGAKLGKKHLCKVQTWHRWSLGMSLSKLCPTAPPSMRMYFELISEVIQPLVSTLSTKEICVWIIKIHWLILSFYIWLTKTINLRRFHAFLISYLYFTWVQKIIIKISGGFINVKDEISNFFFIN
jgi:hypothetical protein